MDEIERAQKTVKIVSVQNEYNIGNRKSEEVLKYCEANGIGFIPWYPVAAGALAKPGGVLDEAAKRHEATVAQLALAWLLHRSPVLLPIPGTPPSLIRVPEGCAFHPRCAYAHETGGRAETEVPELREIEPGHMVACHLTTSQRQQAWELVQQAQTEVTA